MPNHRRWVGEGMQESDDAAFGHSRAMPEGGIRKQKKFCSMELKRN
jgi:hypothetical protein